MLMTTLAQPTPRRQLGRGWLPHNSVLLTWTWLLEVVLPHKPCSGCQQDTLPQQVEVGSPIHLPFERFQPIDLAFGLTVAIRCF